MKTTILDATTTKDLGLNKDTVNKIVKMYTKQNLGARTISDVTGISRRKTMRALELKGVADFSAGSYA